MFLLSCRDQETLKKNSQPEKCFYSLGLAPVAARLSVNTFPAPATPYSRLTSGWWVAGAVSLSLAAGALWQTTSVPFSDYIVYVDESGDHSLTSIDPEFPVFVFAFCIFENSAYARTVLPSLQSFKFKYFGHDLVNLHSHEIRKARKELAILRDRDLVSKVLSTVSVSRPVRTVSAMTAHNPIFDDSQLSVVHLNGTLDDAPNDVTFSRSLYAQRSNIDPAYAQLKNDLLFRSVVFIGASMEEGPLWQHLELRGHRVTHGQRELRPRS